MQLVIFFIALLLLVVGYLAYKLSLIGSQIISDIFWSIFEGFYWNSQKFLALKESIKENTAKCNELNAHIEKLKQTYSRVKTNNYGQAYYIDQSAFQYRRPELYHLKNNNRNEYFCSLSICKNAQSQPFKYLCKYFNIEFNGDTLSCFEYILNDYAAAEEGKVLLMRERNNIFGHIYASIPFLIREYRKDKLFEKLGFDKIDFSRLYFPKYTFKYISPGGYSSMSCDIVLDIENLNLLVNYLSSSIIFKKSIEGQRALMTSALREKIKQRDNYSCQICGASTKTEPNLLLEIDHIIPLSKNGITSEENLQTLCWRCNRAKSNKIIN